VPIDDFYRASKAALQDLNVDIKVQEQDGLAGQVLACDANSDNIVIDMEAMPGSKTTFSIRVGWADENKTQIVFNKLKKHL
jgi:16S rRNA C967 or C1407 C5-methylase (RsmB/RsmF family)